VPGGDRHIVLLDGTEPSLRWRTFVDGVLDLAQELGVRRLVTLGALQVDVPHTRPVPVTGFTSTPELAARIGLRRSTYEGPTGITGVLTVTAAQRGLDTVSLWAGVPHYLSGASYLAGAAALGRRLERLLDTDLGLGRLHRDAEEQAGELADLTAADQDLAEYVAELEGQTDEQIELDAPMPTGEELAQELERYLRLRGGEQ
jgi:proteasome assembly chaperone (PAC2) family protein